MEEGVNSLSLKRSIYNAEIWVSVRSPECSTDKEDDEIVEGNKKRGRAIGVDIRDR